MKLTVFHLIDFSLNQLFLFENDPGISAFYMCTKNLDNFLTQDANTILDSHV